MLKEYWNIQVGLGILAIGLSLFYLKFESDRTSFRWLFLLGHMGVVGGVIASGQVNFWIGASVFISWFIIAGYFYYQERKERTKQNSRP